MKKLLAIILTLSTWLLPHNIVFAAQTHSIDLEGDSSQSLSVADGPAAFDITGDISIEAWVALESGFCAANDCAIVAKRATGQQSYLWQIINADYNMNFQYFGGGASKGRTTSQAAFATRDGLTFYHVVVTADVSEGEILFYVNGALQTMAAVSGTATAIDNTTSTFYIGADGTGTGRVMDGKVDDVRLWSRVLTATEISDNYQEELCGTESGLNAYYQLNNNLDDATSGGNTLTNNNSAVFSTTYPTLTAASCAGAVVNQGSTYISEE